MINSTRALIFLGLTATASAARPRSTYFKNLALVKNHRGFVEPLNLKTGDWEPESDSALLESLSEHYRIVNQDDIDDCIAPTEDFSNGILAAVHKQARDHRNICSVSRRSVCHKKKFRNQKTFLYKVVTYASGMTKIPLGSSSYPRGPRSTRG